MEEEHKKEEDQEEEKKEEKKEEEQSGCGCCHACKWGEEKMADALVVGSKVKEAVKKEKLNMSGEFIDGMSAVVAELVKKAAARCKANGRKTVRSCDI